MEESKYLEIEALGDTVAFEDEMVRMTFSDKLIELHSQESRHDLTNEYKLNSFNYRSPEFQEGTDLVVAGCSYTYGIGLREDTIWGAQLANMHGLNYANISMPGGSAIWVIDQLFKYFNTYGNPKYLAVLLPNVYRGLSYLDTEITYGGGSLETDEDIVPFSPRRLAAKDFPKLSKKPHDVHDITSPKQLIYDNIAKIRMLEQYCEAAGITFKWAVFEAPTEIFLRKVEELYPFKNRIDLGRSDWAEHFRGDVNGFFLRDYEGEPDTFIKCCEEKREWAGEAFDLATDRETGLDRAHPGVHSHIHAAKDFSNELFGGT